MEHVHIRHSKRAKRLALRLDSKNRCVELVIPQGISDRNAHRFLNDHKQWVEEKLAELPPPLPFDHGRIIPILGQDREIVVHAGAGRKTTHVDLQDHQLIVKTNKTDPSQRIERSLKTLAKDTLTDMAEAKAVDIGKPIKSISVRDTKTRWGSCSEDGKLSFSWRLIFAPTLAMDYVVAHEVAHLIHMHHRKSFWALCRELSIDFMEGEYWMRNHGHELMRYGQNA